MNSVAFIGDPHGCPDELKLLVEELLAQGVKRFRIAGDYVDRGPNSQAVVEYCMRNGITGVQGNHDGRIVELWDAMKKQGGKYPTKNPDKINTLSQLTEDAVEYLRKLPKLEVFDDLKLVLVHGGLFPYLPFHEQLRFGNAICRLQMIHTGKLGATRWWGTDKNGRTEADNRAEGWVPWYDLYDHEYDVVFGHSVFKEPFVRQNPGAGRTIGVDTGCVFGNKLTAVVMPEMRFVSVPAAQRYSGTRVID